MWTTPAFSFPTFRGRSGTAGSEPPGFGKILREDGSDRGPESRGDGGAKGRSGFGGASGRPTGENRGTRALNHRPHAIVIGSGFGGLAAAIRLGARGYRVSVLERLEQAGGRASVFRQDGFTFDAGPTIITLPFLFEELWALCGRKLSDDVRFVPLDPFYKLKFDDGSEFTCTGDPEKMRAEVERLSPGDGANYERFQKHSKSIYHFAFEKLGQIPFSSFLPMIKAAPNFARFRADQSVYNLASRYFKDERLRIAFSFHPLFIGGNPLDSTNLYALVSYLEHKYGVHFVKGGTGALVAGLVDLIEGQGNTVSLNTEVDEILLDHGRDGRPRARGVKLADGREIAADIVVSNADAGFTYSRLLPSWARKRWTDERLNSMRYSMSLVIWHFGTKRRYENVDHHTILLGPRYGGLLRDIFNKKVLAEDFSLYLHRPTATDPSLAPEGCDTFYALAPVPHLDGDTDWQTTAESYRARIAKRLSERLLPGLEDEIVTSKLFRPIDFRDRLNSPKGAAFSFEPVMLQSAWFRPHNKSEDVDGLFLVGAGTHPGAGVPGVVSSARILDQVVPDASAFV
jgi:phytoene desaturase